jgi:hypothetical protein
MADPRVLTLSDLSESEIEMLKLHPEARFSTDGKTVELPADPVDDRGIPDFEAGAKKLPVPPPPEHIAKRLAEGFTPPASSMVVEEDGKVVKAVGTPAVEDTSVKATDAELAEYLRCLLGGKSFSKTYEFMGGHVKVTMRERTADEDEDVVRRTMITAAAQNQSQNAVVLTLLMSKYRLAYSITKLTIGNMVKEYTKIPVGALDPVSKSYAIDGRIAELGDLPGALAAVANIAMVQFSELTGDIAKRATDPKSWQTLSAV